MRDRPAALAVVMVGTIMVSLDTTIVSVALRDIALDLGAGSGIAWVASSYLVAVCASQPASGWLTARWGPGRTYLVALVGFCAASGAAALAGSLGQLIAARIAQGLFGGLILPVGMTLILSLYPRERHGRALALWAGGSMLAPALGPTLGGWISTTLDWHLLFLVNLPLGAVATAVGLRTLPRRPASTDPLPRLDLVGLVTGVGALTLAVTALSRAEDWGWASPPTVGALVLAVGCGWRFVRRELAGSEPLVALSLFRRPQFAPAMAVVLMVSGAQLARLVYLPLELHEVRAMTSLRIGILFLPASILQAVGITVGGRIADRSGPRGPVALGCLAMVVGLGGLAALRTTTPVALIAVLLSVQGFGAGLTVAPAMVAGLSDLPSDLVPHGTAIRALTSQVAGALSVAGVGAVVAAVRPHGAREAYAAGFAAVAAWMVVATVLALRLRTTTEPRRPPCQECGSKSSPSGLGSSTPSGVP